MKLSIDSTINTRLVLSLDDKQKEITYDSPRDQDTLAAISEFLSEMHVEKSQLTAIEVQPGPGHFTSIRTSIAIAQTFSLTLNIPINGKPPGTTIEAEYGKPPSITERKN